jgi:hypothetical protein
VQCHEDGLVGDPCRRAEVAAAVVGCEHDACEVAERRVVGVAGCRGEEDVQFAPRVDGRDGDGREAPGRRGDRPWEAQRLAVVDGAAEIELAADREARW